MVDRVGVWWEREGVNSVPRAGQVGGEGGGRSNFLSGRVENPSGPNV